MSVSDSVLLRTTEFLGKCYDVLDLDPFDLATSKPTQAILVDTAKLEERSGRQIAIGTDLDTIAFTEFDKRAAMLFSLHDFQRTFRKGTDFSIGVPGVFQFSLSKSYQTFKREITARRSMQTFVKAQHREYRLSLQMDHPAGLPPLDPIFARQATQLTNAYTDEYRHFVDRFGTHFANAVILGGQAYQRTTMSQESFFQLTQSGTNVNIGAMATFEVAGAPVSLGGSWDNQSAKQHMSKLQKVASVEKIQFSGGTKIGGLVEWADSVCQNPVPVELTLTPIWELLSKDYFPNDPQIDAKKELMVVAVTSHIQEKGEDSRARAIRYGDPVFLGIADIQPTVYYLGGPWSPTLPVPQRDPAWAFEFRNPKDLDSRDLVRTGDEVAIYHHGLRKYLSRTGNGVNPTATDPRRTEATWQILSGLDSLHNPLLDGHVVQEDDLVALQVPSDPFSLMHIARFSSGNVPVTMVFVSSKHKVASDCQWLVSKSPVQ